MSAPVEITESEGEYTAIDAETGVSGRGESRAAALLSLAIALDSGETESVTDPADAMRVMSKQTQARFEEAGVTEEDIEDAISWARSE